MEVEFVVDGMYLFLDGEVEPLNLWYVFSFGYVSKPYMQEGQCATCLFNFPVHPYFLDAEFALGVVMWIPLIVPTTVLMNWSLFIRAIMLWMNLTKKGILLTNMKSVDKVMDWYLSMGSLGMLMYMA